MADAVATAKETVAKTAADKAKAVAEADKVTQSTPTPTQAENDLARLAGAQDEKQDDGSGPTPNFVLTRQVEAEKPKSGYQTRQAPTREPPKAS